MNRHYYAVAMAAIIIASCNKVSLADINIPGEEQTKPMEKAFTFHVKGDFSTCYTEMGTRAAVRLEDNNVADLVELWVLDYVDGVLKQQVYQSRASANFGTVPMSLTYGHHDIKFVASKGTNATLADDATQQPPVVGSTAATLSWSKVMDTFALDYSVDVTSVSNGNRAPELKRAIGGVTVVMTDAVPLSAATAEVTMKKSMSLALPSLEVATPTAMTTTLAFPSSYIGKEGKEFKVYTLVGDDIVTDVAMVFKDAGGTAISSVTVPGVEIKRNRMTTLKGACFSTSASVQFGVGIDNDWLAPEEEEF